MSTKTLENQTFLSGLLDEGAPGRSLAAFRSCIAPSGGDGVYTGCDWAAKMGIPAISSSRRADWTENTGAEHHLFGAYLRFRPLQAREHSFPNQLQYSAHQSWATPMNR